MLDGLLFDRSVHPLGESWESWASIWCKWMLSIPKKKNPSLDETGKYCSINQSEKKVWFLTGTFGNVIPIKRVCTIPVGRAIFFPILMKEDSLEEDSDLKTVSDLRKRCRDAMNQVIDMKATIDGLMIKRLYQYRVQSNAFCLAFPKDNVYGVRPGRTLSVCDGYWLFIRPLGLGKHEISFMGETSLTQPNTLVQLKRGKAHRHIQRHIAMKERDQLEPTFKLAVSYNLIIE